MRTQRVDNVGQIKEGDFLIIGKCNGVFFPAVAKIVKYPGNENEEVIFSVKSNRYFITAMVLDSHERKNDSSGWLSEITIIRDCFPTIAINNMNYHI